MNFTRIAGGRGEERDINAGRQGKLTPSAREMRETLKGRRHTVYNIKRVTNCD